MAMMVNGKMVVERLNGPINTFFIPPPPFNTRGRFFLSTLYVARGVEYQTDRRPKRWLCFDPWHSRFSSQTMSANLTETKPDRSRDQPQTVTLPAPTHSSDASTPISKTDPRDWTYIAEGGSTIVFSYDGPRNLHFDGTVIRLRKSLISPSDLIPPTSDEPDADDPTVDFQEYVTSRLVPAEFLPHLEHVQVERTWLEKIVSTHHEKRPAKRREKDRIDVERTRAVLATDLIGSKGWAVEIKVHLQYPPNILRYNYGDAYSPSGDSNLMPPSSLRPHVLSNCAYAGSA